MTRIIGIVSGKGGVGKTTTTINLAASLMEFKRNVIAVDADISMSGLGLQLGMYYFPLSLNDVLKGEGELFEALYIHSSGLRIIPASLNIDDVKISNLQQILKDSLLEDNIVLIDSPPGFEKNSLAVLKTCPELLIVTTPEIPAITDALKVISITEKMSATPIGIIVNMYKEKESNQINLKEIQTICGLPVVGVIPEDGNIKKSIFKGVPAVCLNPHAPSSIAFRKIAASLIGEDYVPTKAPLLKKIFGRFRK
jgi:septum site-determining protein MinD